MLLEIAEAATSLGHEVHVVGPDAEDGVLAAAAQRGLEVTALSPERRDYMHQLREWDRRRDGVLWCNGLVPAVATTGRGNRIVHLHQATSRSHVAAGRTAALRSLALLVPSRSMARHFPTAQVLPNWVQPVRSHARSRDAQAPVVLGFLGRPCADKGVLVLSQALRLLDLDEPGRYRLLLAGEPRFVSEHERARTEAALAPVAHLVDRPGWMSREDFFSQVDLAVFPSTCPESFGLIVAEAMSAATPFVISDAGALPEVAGADYPWVARAGSTASLLRTIRLALTAESQVRSAAAEHAHRRWQEQFSPQAGRMRMRCLLTDVLPGEAS